MDLGGVDAEKAIALLIGVNGIAVDHSETRGDGHYGCHDRVCSHNGYPYQNSR